MAEKEPEADENCPCKRQRLRQGEEFTENESGCALTELWTSLDPATQQVGEPAAQRQVPDSAGDRVPENGIQNVKQDVNRHEQENSPNVSNQAIQGLKTEKELNSNKNVMLEVTDKPDMGIQGDLSYRSSIEVLSFGEYDLETGETAQHSVAGLKKYHAEHSDNSTECKLTVSEQKKHLMLSTPNSMDVSDPKEQVTGEEIRALAENNLIGTLEKTKFTASEGLKLWAGASTSAYDRQEKVIPTPERENIPICQQSPEADLLNKNQNAVMPPEYLSDSGFIEMFSNDYVNSQKLSASGINVTQSDSGHKEGTGKSLFRIKPKVASSSENVPQRTLILPDSFTRHRPNELFDIETLSYRETALISSINALPASLLVEIFKYFTPCTLLQKISCVCKYWYNLSRDPDLWRTLNLRNQHKLTDIVLEQLLKFSERVLHVNLTDCRFITDKGIKAVLSKCQCIQTFKLMRCFDLTDQAFEGLAMRKLCSQLSALHLDGCYKISDRTVQEVSEACTNLKLLHLNQCNKVTDTGAIALAHNCPKLRQLLLDHCDKVTNASITELVQGCPDLVYLNFMSCGVSDDGVRQLAKLKNLANLDLSNIPRLTPGPVMEIARSCERLECINISLNSVMNDDCVSYIARYCRKLKRLYCVSCHITDKGLTDIANSCPTLEALDVGWCQDITDFGVKVISHACTHLEYFGLIRCDKVTLVTIEELVLQYPHINYSTFILESRRLLERARREGFQCAYLPTAPH